LTDPPATLRPRLLQLVPRFRPDMDGLGECALNLGNALKQFHGVASHFLVAHPALLGQELDASAVAPHTVTRLAAPGAVALNRELDRLVAESAEPPVLLLHYVGYGYSREGIPLWLPGAVQRFRARGGSVVTLFHELYAHGRVPSKTFFASVLQRRIFRRLLALSDAAFTSNEVFLAQMKAQNNAHRPVSLIGICSNVGEPERPRPFAERMRRLAVFGRFATRRHLYQRHGAALLAVAHHLGIEEIADIGPVEDAKWMESNVGARFGALVRTYGALPAEAVSALLEDSMLGAVSNPYSLAGKSGVVAAYQAHAVGVLLFPYGDEVEPHGPGSWALSADELLALEAGLAALTERMAQAAEAGHQHYRQFRSARAMAETLLPALRGLGFAP
jgi:hypothetical protein